MDASSVSPAVQLVGTFLTVLGGIAVAWIANKSKQTDATHSILAAEEELEILKSVKEVHVTLRDFWTWQREREQIMRDRHEYWKEKWNEK